VWGRGAWDDKGSLFAILEAVELLTAQGRTPRRTVYLAFGHDEETGPTAGQQGAHEIVERLRARGVRLASVLDEGLLISHDAMQGLDAPVALIGIAEKGYLTLTLSTEATGGHASMPSARSAIGALSAALIRVEQQQLPEQLSPAIRQMLETLAPHLRGLNRLALANLWLFWPLVERQLAATPAGRAMLHTTVALATVQAGISDHALPALAQAQINFRLLPGDSVASVMAHTREVVADPSVTVAAQGVAWEPSRLAHTGGPAYQAIEQAVREVFPEALVAPGLMIGATDSRHYLEIADEVYRFTPVHASKEDLPRFHGANERVAVSNLVDMIRFHHRLLELLAFAG
jgi:carboxypeptidase PM20D1